MRWMAALVLVIAACGGDDGLDDLTGPDCVASTTSIDGTIDGSSFSLDLATMSRAFQQIQDPGTFDVIFADGGELHLTWIGLIGDGEVVAANGSIIMPTGAPRETEALSADDGSAVQPLADAVRFRVVTASGEIDGCVGD